ncbi:hypothetical protein MFFC18_41580 [Mariniblastus fucicola]|uniref:Uncharacterized protein n=1 Tax=Mariniblastus fucicola TaxID=980251 RepID=A0A5B9PNV7_9BACT|nr:hypothetical protein MFFC18_41580 [Mariniblastus fucicola]
MPPEPAQSQAGSLCHLPARPQAGSLCHREMLWPKAASTLQPQSLRDLVLDGIGIGGNVSRWIRQFALDVVQL